jgi:transcriptional regulator GlxA family with amidase domain
MEMIKPLTIDEIYISPFTARRVYDDDGFVHWEPIERNVHPTGLRQVDAVIQAYAEGVSDAGVIAERLGCRREDIRGLVRVLTGMDIREFRHAYGFRLADDLLRYTSWSIDRVAARSGFRCASLLCQQYLKYFKVTPDVRRRRLRQRGDKDRYTL